MQISAARRTSRASLFRPAAQARVSSGWMPCAMPVQMEITTRERLAMTPYAATAVLPPR